MSGGIGVRADEGAGVEIPEIGIGMLGYAFMGKAHANGYKTLSYMAWPPPLMPRLVSIAGRDEGAVRAAAARYGHRSRGPAGRVADRRHSAGSPQGL